MIENYGELRKLLRKEKSGWMPDEKISDDEKIPEYSLGAEDDPIRKEEVEKLDLKKTLDDEPANPFLLKRRKNQEIISPDPEFEPSAVINPITNEAIDLKTVEEEGKISSQSQEKEE
jgi:hypothetical protein